MDREMRKARIAVALPALAVGLLALLGVCCPAVAALRMQGQVEAGHGAVAGSTVSLWAAGADAPVRLAQTQTDAGGQFVVSGDQTPSGTPVLYLVASGGTPAANKVGGNNSAL